MSIALWFFLSSLLNNFRNLVIFCINVDIDMLLLLWKFFNILNKAAIYIDHYLAGVFNKQCLFTFFSVHASLTLLNKEHFVYLGQFLHNNKG